MSDEIIKASNSYKAEDGTIISKSEYGTMFRTTSMSLVSNMDKKLISNGTSTGGKVERAYNEKKDKGIVGWDTDNVVFVSNLSSLSSDSVTCYKLLKIFATLLTKNISSNKAQAMEDIQNKSKRTVSITASDLMSLTEYSNSTVLKRNINSAMETLMSLTFSINYKYYVNGKERMNQWTGHIIDSTLTENVGIGKDGKSLLDMDFFQNGRITVVFSEGFCMEAVLSNKFTYVSPHQYKLDAKKDEIAFYINDKLEGYHGMSIGRRYYHQRISVSKLMEVSQNHGMTTYEKVKATNRNYYDRLIAPLERELDKLVNKVPILKEWHYEDANGKKLSRIVADKKYETWITLFIKYEFSDNYPAEKRLEQIAHKDKERDAKMKNAIRRNAKKAEKKEEEES